MNEPMRILIAYDGSRCADDALEDLRRAGLPPFAGVLMVNVEEVWLPFPVVLSKTAGAAAQVRPEPVRTSKANRTERQFKTVSAAARLRSFFPEWRVETEFSRGSPAAIVLSKAGEWKPDLIVTGSHGQNSSERFWLGSVSQKIANEAGCAVRVASSHGNWKNGSPVRILIGLDGTEAALAAVEEAATRFWVTGSEVRLVVAIDKTSADFSEKIAGAPNSSPQAAEEKSAPQLWVTDFVERARRRLARAELQITESLAEGDPKQILVAEAEEWGADCIFIGAGENGRGGKNLLLGSVATAVLARAHCTVEIIRHRRGV